MKATSSWLETWKRFRPDAEALYDVAASRRWTYRQLADDARAWAGRLARAGVRSGDRVGVLAQNRGETIALLFACGELGAILLPLNWRLSVAELTYQLEAATPRILLAEDRYRAGAYAALGGESIEAGPGDEPVDGPGAPLDAPWVMMFTSGSTGRPKGALLTHGQLHWNALNTILACDLTTSDATLTFTPLFHPGGLNSLTSPLLHRGGRVVLTQGFEAGEALRLIEAERVTLLMGVPTIFQMMSEHPTFGSTDLSSVRDALCGGASLSLPLLRLYLDRRIPLRQGFGLTEVGPNCFSMPPHETQRKLGSVGMPIHHVAAKLVRPDGSECAPGESGELLLSGPAVCGGYWNNPEATAASIRDGWFHTGDVLSRDEEGYFYVRGRIKEMYISGGENVYPAEIEAALTELPGVASAAVFGVADERWGEVGCAYLVARPGHALTSASVLAGLEGRLARFKLPKRIRFVDALPLTASGKVDKPLLTRLESA
jgi:fatty-acyl-CoA synthase